MLQNILLADAICEEGFVGGGLRKLCHDELSVAGGLVWCQGSPSASHVAVYMAPVKLAFFSLLPQTKLH